MSDVMHGLGTFVSRKGIGSGGALRCQTAHIAARHSLIALAGYALPHTGQHAIA